MSKEENRPTIHFTRPSAPSAFRRLTSVWRRLPAIAKCIIILPMAMTLLGAEIELRLSPQLDLLVTAASIWGFWASLSN